MYTNKYICTYMHVFVNVKPKRILLRNLYKLILMYTVNRYTPLYSIYTFVPQRRRTQRWYTRLGSRTEARGRKVAPSGKKQIIITCCSI